MTKTAPTSHCRKWGLTNISSAMFRNWALVRAAHALINILS